MAVKRGKYGLRVNYLIIFLSGMVLLVAGILVFMLVIKNVYGNYKVPEILPTPENLQISTSDKRNKVAVLYSQYTQNMLDEGSTWLNDNIDTWENFLKANKFPYDIINDQTIELGQHYDYKVIVLPGSKSLSDKEIIQLKKYIERGGSVFATSGTATFSDEAKWRGWSFVTEVFGLKFNKEIRPDEITKIHTLRGNLPLTAGIPTGYSLDIATWDRPIYVEIVEPRTTQVSFWYDFRREKGLVQEAIQKSAGIAYGTYGKGRFVWYGFELNSVVGEQEDYIYFDRLFRNSLNWLTYNPTAYVKDWPAPYEAAAVIVPMITEQPNNALNLLPILKNNNIQATYFVDPLKASEYPGIIKTLSKSQDIGAVVDVGFLFSLDDTINTFYDKEIQFADLAFAKDTLSKLADKPIESLMPLFGFYNEYTLQGMSKENMRFLVTDSLTDRSVPKIEIRDGKPIMIFTKTARDDYKIVRDYGLTDTEFQRYTYEEDIDRIKFEGGLLVFKVHTDYQLRAEYVNVMNSIVKYLRDNNYWITSFDELSVWWLRRGGIEMRYETRSKRRIAVEVSNPTKRENVDFTVELNLNKQIKNVEISSDIINTKIPEYTFDSNTSTLYLYVEDLDVGETRSYLIDFENIES